MYLKFNERPYSGKTFRPRPEIHIDPESRTVIIATPWGPREAATKVIERMNDYLALARSDNEATSPFQKVSCLSDLANSLRIAALLANESLYRDENRIEYRAGVELFAGVFDAGEFSWLQSGNPQILLSRPGRSLLPQRRRPGCPGALKTGSSTSSPSRRTSSIGRPTAPPGRTGAR